MAIFDQEIEDELAEMFADSADVFHRSLNGLPLLTEKERRIERAYKKILEDQAARR